MKRKVILISIDGMCPDGLQACGNPFVSELEKRCSYTYSASSMNPSVTFPCHYSMAHSVTPQRHGIITNTYVPQVRPVNGLFEVLRSAGAVSSMYYGWEPLRDIANPRALKFSVYMSARFLDACDEYLTSAALRQIEEFHPDFVFLYLVDTDEKGGHDHGWMSEEYLCRIRVAIDQVKRVFEAAGDEYSIIIMADHGGHDRTHGTLLPEDMTVPMFLYGPEFVPGETVGETSLLDIAPTVADVMGVSPDPDWEGKSLVKKDR